MNNKVQNFLSEKNGPCLNKFKNSKYVRKKIIKRKGLEEIHEMGITNLKQGRHVSEGTLCLGFFYNHIT